MQTRQKETSNEPNKNDWDKKQTRTVIVRKKDISEDTWIGVN